MTSPHELILADDHPVFRRGLADVLREEPSVRVVGEAGDGEEALALIRARRPAVAILDVHMPKRTGLEVARALKEEGHPTRVVLLTMHEDPEFLEAAMDLGVCGYVLKENAVTDVLAALKTVLEDRIYISPTMSGLVARRAGERASLKREKPGLDRLTPAERRILRLIADDKTTKEIAGVLGISVRTVDTHRQNMSHKLHLEGAHSLLKFAFANRSRL
ncbi:MAG: response regulator transcription factor [Verrucomicrobiae bacterium]|nr:response regulator transcription factor [Verrucomicrobiae bacterium]